MRFLSRALSHSLCISASLLFFSNAEWLYCTLPLCFLSLALALHPSGKWFLFVCKIIERGNGMLADLHSPFGFFPSPFSSIRSFFIYLNRITYSYRISLSLSLCLFIRCVGQYYITTMQFNFHCLYLCVCECDFSLFCASVFGARSENRYQVH